jgi:hypothetical protein
VVEQREAYRLSSKKQDKDSKSQAPATNESLCSTILSKMVKDILGNEVTTGIVSDILNQQPRLYCFFDKEEAIKVNRMMHQKKDRLFEQNTTSDPIPPLSSRRPSMRVPEPIHVKHSEDTGSIDEHHALAQDRLYSHEQDKRHSDPSEQLNQSKRRDSPQLSANSQKDREDTGRRPLHVPEHLTPQDIIMESDQEQRQESIIHEEGHKSESQTLKDHAVQQLLARDDFKSASQAIFDDIFFSLIKESVTGHLNLNEKQVRSSTRTGPKRTLTRMRSHLTTGQQPSASHLK